MSAGNSDGLKACNCPQGCSLTEDGHWINCPAHQYYDAYLAYTRTEQPADPQEHEAVRELTLAECPVGLFMCRGVLCLKTEYGNNEGRIDAYIVSSGEFFWGSSPQSIANQRVQRVVPIAVCGADLCVCDNDGMAHHDISCPAAVTRSVLSQEAAESSK